MVGPNLAKSAYRRRRWWRSSVRLRAQAGDRGEQVVGEVPLAREPRAGHDEVLDVCWWAGVCRVRQGVVRLTSCLAAAKHFVHAHTT